jgi:very-short-patch-repair endonuclease
LTKPEELAWRVLEDLGFQVKHYKDKSIIDYANTFYFQYPLEEYFLDFALIQAKIAIEIQGEYWHAKRTTSLNIAQLQRQINDSLKRSKLQSLGWQLIECVPDQLKRENVGKFLQTSIFNLLIV